MDLWQLIKHDHDNVDELFRQILSQSSGGLRDRLFRQLKDELDLHTKVEEDLLYPALAQFEETRKFLPDARSEHTEMKKRLEALRQGDKDSEQWAQRFSELKALVQHHVRNEEDKIFPAARQVIDAARAEELKHQIEREKTAVLQEHF